MAGAVSNRPASSAISALALAAAVLAGSGSAAQEGSLEYPIKATFLVRFAAYVSWPDAAFASRSSPLQLCVVGADPFGGLLEQLATEEHVGDRTLTVRRPLDADDVAGCHILYLGRLAVEENAGVLARSRGQPMLVVTDAAQTSGAHGAIHFVIVDDRVRFHIDEAAAERNQLRVSSQLLSVALSVKRSGDR